MKLNEEELHKQIGERIRQKREAKQISQQAMAESTNIPQTTISKIENGEITFNVYKLTQIANYLGISAGYLCTGIEENDILTILSQYVQLKYTSCTYDDTTQDYPVLEINSDFLNYLFQMAQSEHIHNLPKKARDAWQNAARKDFVNAPQKQSLSFIPFPAEQITKNSPPNCWHEPELLKKSDDNLHKLFS